MTKYLTGMAMKSLVDKDHKETIILEWYKYAVANREHHQGRKIYIFPFDASDADMYETDGDNLFGTNELLQSKMWQQGMYRIMGITDNGMQRIRDAASTGVLPPHGLTGKEGNNLMDIEVRLALEDHFDKLCSLGEVRATRVMATLVDGGRVLTNRGNEADADKNIYLPTSDGYRPCYRQFMLDRGYKTTTADNGKITLKWIQKECEPVVLESDCPKIVCLRTYMNMWKRKYPYLKASRPVEDTCGDCYRFAMRHKYLSMHRNPSNNSHGDANWDPLEEANSLFTSNAPDELTDSHNKGGGDSDVEDDGGKDDDSNADDDMVSNDNVNNNTTNNNTTNELMALLENPDAAASNPYDESIETLMMRCALHVQAARIMRILYQEAAQ